MVSPGICIQGFLDGIHDKWIIIVVADFVSDDRSIIEVFDSTEISLRSKSILQVGHICTPFLIRCCVSKITIEKVFCIESLSSIGARMSDTANNRTDSQSSHQSTNPFLVIVILELAIDKSGHATVI